MNVAKYVRQLYMYIALNELVLPVFKLPACLQEECGYSLTCSERNFEVLLLVTIKDFDNLCRPYNLRNIKINLLIFKFQKHLLDCKFLS